MHTAIDDCMPFGNLLSAVNFSMRKLEPTKRVAFGLDPTALLYSGKVIHQAIGWRPQIKHQGIYVLVVWLQHYTACNYTRAITLYGRGLVC